MIQPFVQRTVCMCAHAHTNTKRPALGASKVSTCLRWHTSRDGILFHSLKKKNPLPMSCVTDYKFYGFYEGESKSKGIIHLTAVIEVTEQFYISFFYIVQMCSHFRHRYPSVFSNHGICLVDVVFCARC
jgi:hypothetical protein